MKNVHIFLVALLVVGAAFLVASRNGNTPQQANAAQPAAQELTAAQQKAWAHLAATCDQDAKKLRQYRVLWQDAYGIEAGEGFAAMSYQAKVGAALMMSCAAFEGTKPGDCGDFIIHDAATNKPLAYFTRDCLLKME